MAAKAWELNFPEMRNRIYVTSSIFASSYKVGGKVWGGEVFFVVVAAVNENIVSLDFRYLVAPNIVLFL